MVYRSARFPAIILLDRSRTRELRAKSVFFSKSKHEIGLCMPIPMKIFFSRSRIQFTPYISTPKRVWLIWSYVMPDGNQVYKRCKYIYWLHFIFHFRKKKRVFAKISYICWSKTFADFDIAVWIWIAIKNSPAEIPRSCYCKKSSTTTRLELAIFWFEVRRLIH